MVKVAGKEVGNIGYGLMGLTWRPQPPSQEQAFEAMRAALSHGANFFNGGELYGTPARNSLHLLNEYFTKYPDHADKVVLSIKGGLRPGEFTPDSSKANVSRSIEESLKVLDGKKFLDVFECARLDGKTPLAETIGTIAEYVKAGKIGGIGLSEVSAKTIREAHAIHPIAVVEVEFSLFSTDILSNGIAATCAELGIPIVAYSPLGRGFLTGQLKSYDDIPDGSFIKTQPRFQPDVFDENLKLVAQVEALAAKKGSTPAQVALGWILTHSGKSGFPQIIPIPGATTEARIKENVTPAKLSEEDMEALAEILKKFPVQGERYDKHSMAHVAV